MFVYGAFSICKRDPSFLPVSPTIILKRFTFQRMKGQCKRWEPHLTQPPAASWEHAWWHRSPLCSPYHPGYPCRTWSGPLSRHPTPGNTKGTSVLQPQEKETLLQPDTEPCFPKWQSRIITNCQSLWQDIRWEENSLGTAFPHFLRLSVDFNSPHILRKPGECGLQYLSTRQAKVSCQKQQRKHLHSPKGSVSHVADVVPGTETYKRKDLCRVQSILPGIPLSLHLAKLEVVLSVLHKRNILPFYVW